MATALSFREVVSRGWFVCRVPFWFCVLRGLVVSCWLGVFVQRPCFSCARNVHLLEPTVLPRLAVVLPRHSMVLPLWCGTAEVPRRAVLPCLGTVLPRRQGRVGVMTRAGEFQLPIPIHLSLSPRLSLSRSRTAPEALAGSPSPATLLGFRPVGSFPTTSSCHGPRFFFPNPSFSWLFSRF